MICRLKCGSVKRSHYHCYVCHRILTKKALVMAHVSRCEQQQQDNTQTSMNLAPKINEEQPDTPPSTILNIKTEDVGTIRETASSLKSVQLCSEDVSHHYSLQPCKGCPLLCTGMKDQVHCPFCPVDKFKPTSKVKVLAHIVSVHCQNQSPSIMDKGMYHS